LEFTRNFRLLLTAQLAQQLESKLFFSCFIIWLLIIFFPVKRDILVKNGSAVDALIAAAFCNSVLNAQSAGIGGGSFMVIYLKYVHWILFYRVYF